MGRSRTQPGAGPRFDGHHSPGAAIPAVATGPRLGIDVVDVSRFERVLALRGDALRRRVFTPAELRACRGRPERLARRMAAKEAVAKALSTGIGPVAWRDVEVLSGQGAPAVRLTGAAAAAARAQGLDRWALSLAGDGGRAVAVVVATAVGQR
ncbi:holo-ACP synthase [Georgenia thermotolerans]|uniref:Holo-[acyl-carrier-protein] synthase n=1 Tax=Georgenia thermotolerans TaxID=527326 RepID=A0A7J5UJI2_9MICO|nr:holo-ACP synthase [Georgenia thermotolerans]KAE8762324.1 holo-[acyl-carrier-protein] synthase [Georgenia thermotolerans]